MLISSKLTFWGVADDDFRPPDAALPAAEALPLPPMPDADFELDAFAGGEAASGVRPDPPLAAESLAFFVPGGSTAWLAAASTFFFGAAHTIGSIFYHRPF